MQLNSMDLNWCVRRLPKVVQKKLEESGDVIAGGYIRSCIAHEDINDIDIFVPNTRAAERLVSALEVDGRGVIRTANASTILGHKYTIQVIHRWTYCNPEDTLNSFDFTIAKAAMWYDSRTNRWLSVCDEHYYEDLAAKRLVYTCPVRNEDAGGSILRVLKFYQRGYRIPLDSLANVVARLVNGVDYSAMITLLSSEDPDNEFEPWLAKILAGLLFEVDPNAVPILADAQDEGESNAR